MKNQKWTLKELDSVTSGKAFHILDETNFGVVPPLKNKKNATLIATAPEMLEALEGIQSAIKNSSYYETADLVPMMAKIRDVIKKAKGEQ